MVGRTPAFFCLLALAASETVSPVQKVVQLLESCKTKIEADLATESKAMDEYTAFCDDELKEKAYAVTTASKTIDDLSATIEDSQAQIAALGDEISTLGGVLAKKDRELLAAQQERASQHSDFAASEKELVKSVDELGRAGTVLKRGSSFVQTRGGRKMISAAVAALSSIVEASWMDMGSQRKLKSFLQAQSSEDDGLSLENALNQPQAKQVAYESSSGGILKTIEDMQEKAEDALSDLRKEEMTSQHGFESVENVLNNEISHSREKLSTNKKDSAQTEQNLQEATGKLGATKKSKGADEAYSATLKSECETKASEWAARLESAKGEMGAIDKASEILVGGVKAFVQLSVRTHRASDDEGDDDDSTADARQKVIKLMKQLNQEHHSYELMQIANMASSDPFVKIRGLIEDMLSKLVKAAQEDATHEAFCDEEMGKSNKAKDEKTAQQDKYKSRMDTTATTIAQLTEAIKVLESELADSDKAQAEATELRQKEHQEYKKASKDFGDSARAVAKATEVLKNYYEGSFIQMRSSTQLQSKQPELGGAKTDTAHTILAVLEMSEEDFTTLLAETEETEADAAKKYQEMTNENNVIRASKQAEAKAKNSEIKSLKVQLEHSSEDHASVSDELDAVNGYLEKLKPECESKAMSYEERKAAREAEIAGLKDALEILSGPALVQTGRQLRVVQRA